MGSLARRLVRLGRSSHAALPAMPALRPRAAATILVVVSIATRRLPTATRWSRDLLFHLAGLLTASFARVELRGDRARQGDLGFAAAC